MIKRILRAGLGVVFFFVFFVFLLVGAVKFRLLSPTFWKAALDKGAVYQQLQDQVAKMRTDLEESIRKQTGGGTVPPEVVQAAMGALAPILSIDKVLTTDRFRELIETNVDRLFGYVNGQDKNLRLFLPVKEWNLPVATLGQPALAKLTGQTPVEDALLIAGVKPEQAKPILEGLGLVKTLLGYLTIVWIALLLLTVGIGVGHYFLGIGLIDRISGTAWLVMISGFIAKLIGIGAGRIFELIASSSKPPMVPWMAEIGRSLVGQFFDLGATIGLVIGVLGFLGVVVAIVLSKQEKIKEEKEKMSFLKRATAFLLGVTLGLAVLAGTVTGLVLALGGKVDFKFGRSGSPPAGGTQTGAGVGTTQAVEEGEQRLTDDYYESGKGWQIQFPAGWEVIKDKESEGVMKKPTGSVTNWATIEIGGAERVGEVDSGGYLAMMKQALGSATGFKNAVLVEEPFEERQEGGGWRRFVFTVDYDGVIAEQVMRLRLYSLQYFPATEGDGFVIMARVPVESWGRYEKILKESTDTFKVGD